MDDPGPPDGTLETATGDDVDELLAMRDDLGRWMVGRGIDQWRPGQFPRSTLDAWVANGWVHVVRGTDGIVGAVAVLPEDTAFWGLRGRDGTAGYVHLLMVRRDLHGHGLGDVLLAGAEHEVAAAGRHHVRLDSTTDNAALTRWYETRGYVAVGRTALTGSGSVTLREKPAPEEAP